MKTFSLTLTGSLLSACADAPADGRTRRAKRVSPGGASAAPEGRGPSRRGPADVPTWGLIVLLTLAGVAALPGAVPREAFSARAQQHIPDIRVVTLRLADGTELAGEILEETDDRYVLQVERGRGITYQTSVMKDQVADMVTVGACDHLADWLLGLPLQRNTALEEPVYIETLDVFDEWLRLCPAHARVEAVREARERFAFELRQVRAGLVKRDGEWLPPVTATVMDYAGVMSRITEMQGRFGGIERPDYRQEPDAKVEFDRLVQSRRSMARRLTTLVATRIPQLLDQGHYEEAIVEVDAFVRFWIESVVAAEAGPSDTAVAETLAGMDFDYMIRLQRDVMAAYLRHRPPPPEVEPPEGMVYVPGGYFLMGNAGAGYQDDDFPQRIVYVAPFFIDRYETTNAEYREFVDHVKQAGDDAVAHPDAIPLKDYTPRGWEEAGLSGDDQPVAGIDWFDAYAYTRWRGKRLPTEAEWELAARGYEGAPFPWGEEGPGGRLVSAEPGRRFALAELNRLDPPREPERRFWGCGRQPPPPPPRTLPVQPWPVRQRLPTAVRAVESGVRNLADIESPFGVWHMGGNVAVWVQDGYDPSFYRHMPLRQPVGPDQAPRVYRGGTYLGESEADLSVFRRGRGDGQARNGLHPASGRPMIGVRGVLSVP